MNGYVRGKGFLSKGFGDLLDTFLAFRFLDSTIMACMLLNRAYSVFFVFSGTTKLETKQHFAFFETNLFLLSMVAGLVQIRNLTHTGH